MVTIIFSNAGDCDCGCILDTLLMSDLLYSESLRNFVNINDEFIRNPDWEDIVDQFIKEETDTLLFIGHGTMYGLSSPDFDSYVLHRNNVDLIKARTVICCWCWASDFCIRNNVKRSFSTSMFISNMEDAAVHNVNVTGYNEIDIQARSFYEQIFKLIYDNRPISEWYDYLWGCRDVNSEVDVFNRQPLCYIE